MKRWSEEKAINELKQLAERGHPLTYRKTPQSLIGACRHLFDSFNQAKIAAGLPLNNHPIKWNISKEEFEEISLKKKMSDKAIAEYLKCPKSTVSSLRRRLGVRSLNHWEKWKRTSLSTIESQVIIGSLLGDAYGRYGKSKHASITFSQSNYDYITWKYEQLKEWATKNPTKSSSRNEYTFTTVSHPVFDSIVDQFYERGEKIIPPSLLRLLDLLGLAVWWMDDGTCCTSQYIKKDRKPSYYKHFQLRTDCFTLNENELLCSGSKKGLTLTQRLNPSEEIII